MRDDILKHMSGFHSSCEAWLILEKNFASKSRPRVIQIKKELQKFKKGNLSIVDYILKVKTLLDELTIIGCGVSDGEKFMYVLSSLDENFHNVYLTIIERF